MTSVTSPATDITPQKITNIRTMRRDP